MNLEGLQQQAHESVIAVFKAMTDIATGEAKNSTVENQILAAKVVESMNETIIKAWLASDLTAATEKATDKMTRQLDKLTDSEK